MLLIRITDNRLQIIPLPDASDEECPGCGGPLSGVLRVAIVTGFDFRPVAVRICCTCFESAFSDEALAILLDQRLTSKLSDEALPSLFAEIEADDAMERFLSELQADDSVERLLAELQADDAESMPKLLIELLATTT